MSIAETEVLVIEGSTTMPLAETLFDPLLPANESRNGNGSQTERVSNNGQLLAPTPPQQIRRKKRRTVSNYLFIFHVIQVCIMFAGVVNLLAYASLFYFIYPIFFAFLFYVIVYHSFRKRTKWVLIPYFIYDIFFLLYNLFLSIVFFMYSAHTIEFQYLTGTPTHIAEIIGALELIILPCQCTFLFIMIRCWHGHPISDFLPKGPRERKWIFVLMTVLVLATIGTLMWAQISGFI